MDVVIGLVIGEVRFFLPKQQFFDFTFLCFNLFLLNLKNIHSDDVCQVRDIDVFLGNAQEYMRPFTDNNLQTKRSETLEMVVAGCFIK